MSSLVPPVFDDALLDASKEVLEVHAATPSMVTGKGCNAFLTCQQRFKRNVHARIAAVPRIPELTRERVPRAEDVGKFLRFCGAWLYRAPLTLRKELSCALQQSKC